MGRETASASGRYVAARSDADAHELRRYVRPVAGARNRSDGLSHTVSEIDQRANTVRATTNGGARLSETIEHVHRLISARLRELEDEGKRLDDLPHHVPNAMK